MSDTNTRDQYKQYEEVNTHTAGLVGHTQANLGWSTTPPQQPYETYWDHQARVDSFNKK